MKKTSSVVSLLAAMTILVVALTSNPAPASSPDCPNQGVSQVPGTPVTGSPISCGEDQCPPSVAITYTYECNAVAPDMKCELGHMVLLFEYTYWKCVNGECDEKTITRKGDALTTVTCTDEP